MMAPPLVGQQDRSGRDRPGSDGGATGIRRRIGAGGIADDGAILRSGAGPNATHFDKAVPAHPAWATPV